MQRKELPVRIRELAHQTGVTRPTIRYYEQIGILPPAARAANGYRAYGAADVERLRFIVQAKGMDFNLDEIREILAFRERGEAPCAYVLGQIDCKVAEIDQRIAALARMKGELRQLQAEADGLPLTGGSDSECVCHLIENHHSTQRSEP